MKMLPLIGFNLHGPVAAFTPPDFRHGRTGLPPGRACGKKRKKSAAETPRYPPILFAVALMLVCPFGLARAAKTESIAGFTEVPQIAGEFMDAQPVIIGDKGSALKDNVLLDYGFMPSKRLFKQSEGDKTAMTKRAGERIIVVTPALMAFRDFKIPELEAYIQTMTNDVHARTVLGVRLYQEGRLDDSLAALRQTLLINPLEERSAELHSGILMQQQAFEIPGEIADEIHVLLDAHPGNNVIRFNLACALARSGQPEAALGQLDVLARAGWPELVYHITDGDFSSLRGRQDFAELQNRLLASYRENLNRYLLGSLRNAVLAP